MELTLFSIANPNISGLQIKAHVLDQIISDSPAHDISSLLNQPFLHDKDLADPDIGKPRIVDLLLGLSDCNLAMQNGCIPSSDSRIVAQESIFDWVIGGGSTYQDHPSIS